MVMITPAEFEDAMGAISVETDVGKRHEKADNLMCKVLSDNGYITGVKIFENMEKWYW